MAIERYSEEQRTKGLLLTSYYLEENLVRSSLLLIDNIIRDKDSPIMIDVYYCLSTQRPNVSALKKIIVSGHSLISCFGSQLYNL